MTVYTAVVLDYLPGGNDAQAFGINASGQVVGQSNATDGFYHAVVWNGTTPTALDFLGGEDEAKALGINALGEIVGWNNATFLTRRATTWIGTTPTAPFGVQCELLAINDDGVSCGDDNAFAISWDGVTEVILDDFPGATGTGSVAYAINASGQIAGAAQDSLAATHCVRWDGVTLTALDYLGGDTVAQAFGMNDSAQIVGMSGTPKVAVVWNGTTPTALDTLPGGPFDQANDINNDGIIVGQTYDGSTSFPAVWEASVLSVLPDLGVDTLDGSALAINSVGDIAGYISADDAFGNHAVKWVAIAEPTPFVIEDSFYEELGVE